MLAVGFIATAAVVALGASVLMEPPCFGCDYPVVLGLPSNVMQAALALAFAAVGLAWMIRIFRGPRDEPPPWRDRDR